MTKTPNGMKPLKIYRLILTGLEDKLSKKDKKQVGNDFELLMDKYKVLSENYSKELLVEIIESYPIFLKALNKLKVQEKETYLKYIDQYVLEEIFFGEHLAKFNGELHAVALHGEYRSALYINGLYCRHFSESNTNTNMVSFFMKSNELKSKVTISENESVDSFFEDENNKAPKWLKDFPGIQSLVTIPEPPTKKIKNKKV